MLRYEFLQFGDFIDVDSANSEIFTDTFRSTGWTPSAHVFGGVDVRVCRRLYLSGEGALSLVERARPIATSSTSTRSTSPASRRQSAFITCFREDAPMTNKLMLAAMLALLSSAPALAQDITGGIRLALEPVPGMLDDRAGPAWTVGPGARGHHGVRAAVGPIRRRHHDDRRRQERARADHRRRRLGAAAVSRRTAAARRPATGRAMASVSSRASSSTARTGRSAPSRASRCWRTASGSMPRRQSSTAIPMCGCGGIAARAISTRRRRP